MTEAPTSVSALRCATVWTTGTAATAGLVAWLLTVLAGSGATVVDPHASFDRLLATVCAALAVAAALWLWAISTVVVLEALTHRPGRVPGVPPLLRGALLAACGAAVLAGISTPTHATAAPQDDRRPQTAAVVIAGLPLPDRAVGSAERAQELAQRTVAVRPGDTLWDLARRELGPAADDAAITARWHEIYALNRAVIGADPDLIQPAQRLRLPAG